LTKHECGSCRFYQEARNSKHGWCTHPERRETTAVRILVRSAELRCRNDWGADLWQERIDNDRVIDVVMHDAGPKSIPEPAARPIPRPVDREPFVQPTVLIGEQPRLDDFERTSLVSKNLNRELLQRAHNQARERQKNRGYSVTRSEQKLADVESEREPLVISNQYVPPSRQLDLKDEVLAPFEFLDHSADGKFDELIAPAPAEDSAWSFDVEETPDRSLSEYRTDDRSASPDDRNDGGYRPNSRTGRLPRPVAQSLRGVSDDAPDRLDSRGYLAEVSSAPRVSRTFEIDLDEDQLEDPDSLFNVEDLALAETWPGSEPQRSGTGVWSGMIRACQTCRDFRPAGNGERGWCNNQWAFKHRRMVDAQDRPCETSIGHWWVPGDAAWQGAFDVSSLGQPTPCVEKYLSPAAERSGGGEGLPFRRRKQS